MKSLAKRDDKYGVIDVLSDYSWPFGFGGLLSSIPGLTNFTTNLVENDNNFVLTADLPGIDEGDINVSFENGILTIACKQEQTRKSDGKYHWEERINGSSSRSFRIADADAEGISAELNKGVLTVTLNKRQKVAPATKRIEVKTK